MNPFLIVYSCQHLLKSKLLALNLVYLLLNSSILLFLKCKRFTSILNLSNLTYSNFTLIIARLPVTTFTIQALILGNSEKAQKDSNLFFCVI